MSTRTPAIATEAKHPEQPRNAPKLVARDGKKPEPAKDARGDARADAPNTAARPRLGGKRIALLVLIVLGTIGTGSAALWVMLPQDAESAPAPAAKVVETVQAVQAEPQKPAPKPRSDKTPPPIFVALETFTVNLQPESGDHMLQTTFSLKITDPALEAALKLYMPEIRSRLLLLLSSRKPSELGSVEGKQALATQIGEEVNAVLETAGARAGADGEGPVRSVFFTAFIIQ